MLEMTLTEFREFISSIDPEDLARNIWVSEDNENELQLGKFGVHDNVIIFHSGSLKVIVKAMIKAMPEARLISLINNLVYETGLDDDFNRVYPFQVVEG